MSKDLILDIDISKVENNINKLKQDKEVILMVKANAYGIGIELVEHLICKGYKYFGVSTLSEALEIRELNKNCEIFIFTKIDKEQYKTAIENNLTLIINDFDSLRNLNRDNKFHLKFDTGMGRIGFSKEDLSEVESYIINNKLNCSGILSHLSTAIDEEITNKQIEIFKQIVSSSKLKYKFIHLQNSYGSANYNLDFCNMCRIGIGMYGLFADEEEKLQTKVKLENALTLKAKVIQEKYYNGEVGYSQTDHVNGHIYTLRIGYADGFRRSMQGYIFNNNSKVVGRVSMCQTIIQNDCINNLTEQEIFGNNESIYSLCKYMDVIVYELLVSISRRTVKNFI